MNLSRYISRRIVTISVAILLAGIALALWRAQFDVEREERGAAAEVRLFERLYALENGPSAEIQFNVDSLQRINLSGDLRHLRFSLRDSNGAILVEPAADEPPGLLLKLFARIAPGMPTATNDTSVPWVLQRDDGAIFQATLSLNPASEQQEALDNLIGMLLVMCGYAIAILTAVYWTLRRALAPMRPILGAIEHYERNDFSHRVGALPFTELDTVGHALNHMASTLAQAQEQRRVLSLKLVSSQEDERSRIARELHDEFGQTLTAMRADLSWLARKVADREDVRDVVNGIAAQCEHLHQDIRELLSRLRPPETRTGFSEPLQKLMEDLVRSWNDRLGEQTRFRLDFAVGADKLPDDIASAIYRLTQEALTNSVRHAAAHNVTVTLARDHSDAIVWSVVDDGIGIGDTEGSLQVGNGLAGMRERAWALGSELEIAPLHTQGERRGLRVAARFAAHLR